MPRPADEVQLRLEVRTLHGPLSCLNEARYGIVWGAVGAGRACFESALDYAKERIVFGKPISAYQLTQRSARTGRSSKRASRAP